MKSLKSLLKENRLIVGLTMQHVCKPWLVELYAQTGTDFVFVEYEHCFFNEADLADFVLVCRMKGLPVVAKLPELNRTSVAKLLEAGVLGIQYPAVSSRADAERFVSLTKFPPRGIRAASPGLGNNDYNLHDDGREFVARGDRETVCIAHIETCDGVKNIDEILSVEGIDMVFLGMYDFSLHFGHPGQFTHPEVIANVEKVLDAARRHGIVSGTWVTDFEAAQPWIKRGVKFFEAASETELIESASKALITQFRAPPVR